MFCRTRYVRCEHTQATTQQHKTTMTSDSEKQTIEAGIKDREEAITRTVEKAVQDLEALARKAYDKAMEERHLHTAAATLQELAEVAASYALTATWLSAELSALRYSMDIMNAEVVDRDYNASINLMQAGKVIPSVPVESAGSR